MPTVNFYLKPAEKSGRSLIFLQFKYHGKKFTFTFGENIDPSNWNSGKQRVKSNNQTTSDGEHSLNDLLDSLAKICAKTYREALKTGIPNNEL